MVISFYVNNILLPLSIEGRLQHECQVYISLDVLDDMVVARETLIIIVISLEKLACKE